MREIVLIGGGGHCHSVIDVIESTEQFQIKGILDRPENVGQFILGYEVIGSDDLIPALAQAGCLFHVSLGQIKTAAIRRRVFESILLAGGTLPVIQSPLAHVSKHSAIGEGTIIMHQALVNAGVRVGRNCILNTKCLLEHDVTVGDHCHLSTASVMNGGAAIGSGSFLGSNATTKELARIGEEVVIGAGVTVVEEVPDKAVYLGKRINKE